MKPKSDNCALGFCAVDLSAVDLTTYPCDLLTQLPSYLATFLLFRN